MSGRFIATENKHRHSVATYILCRLHLSSVDQLFTVRRRPLSQVR